MKIKVTMTLFNTYIYNLSLFHIKREYILIA